ncbi:hypothetical protein QFC20_007822 [Naganishia adeliensis]|uniref:Uncharacterized protein n=1 Tax=Naganishia adeliensis TaxID=92952 RepID=A0ACC2UVU3_9TREE|nr:hypothetical protein QFC20_007822 [Naganishia adeliensis]
MTYIRFERELNTCERLFFYGDLPVEALAQSDSDPDQTWPSKGEITFDDVKLRYRPELQPVPKGVSFHISPGEKVTPSKSELSAEQGSRSFTPCAGKSSCLQALFRLVELSAGKITIDGINLAEIGLNTLRHRLSAIPQEPLLFSGTMRDNLDPQGISSDSELHDALRRCALVKPHGENQERFNKFRLDAQVADEGSNFSRDLSDKRE